MILKSVTLKTERSQFIWKVNKISTANSFTLFLVNVLLCNLGVYPTYMEMLLS